MPQNLDLLLKIIDKVDLLYLLDKRRNYWGEACQGKIASQLTARLYIDTFDSSILR